MGGIGLLEGFVKGFFVKLIVFGCVDLKLMIV